MSKAHYWNQCPLCGATLDPGETCDCEKEQPTDIREERKTMPPKAEETRMLINMMLDKFEDEKLLKRIYAFLNRLNCMNPNPGSPIICNLPANRETLEKLAGQAEIIVDRLANLSVTVSAAGEHDEMTARMFLDMFGREAVDIGHNVDNLRWKLKALSVKLQ